MEGFYNKHKPKDDIKSLLVFALKYEALDLYILKKNKLTSKEIVLIMLDKEPTSQFTRRIWFLYECVEDTIEKNHTCRIGLS